MVKLLVGAAGLLLISVILWDAFETVVLPRRVTRRLRLAVFYFETMWGVWFGVARAIRSSRRRESFLSLFGPLSLVLLMATWAASLAIGFAFVYVAAGLPAAPIGGSPTTPGATFATALYFSGSTMFTLGLGDVVPHTWITRALAAIEAFTGFAFLALVISYLPVIYQAFSRRESHTVMLDEWAGSPPSAGELLRRLGRWDDLHVLDAFFSTWERWAAELLESHISYPVLAGFRSQHGNESWLAALTMVLDASVLVLAGVEGVKPRQAWLTFAMARHVAVDLCQVLDTPPHPPSRDRLPSEDFQRLRVLLNGAGVILRDGEDVERRLAELRQSYEPYVAALGEGLLLALPSWLPRDGAKDNWQKTAWD